MRVYGALKCGLLVCLVMGIGQARTDAQVANPADAAASEAAEARRGAAEVDPPPTARELELERRIAELERATGAQQRQSDAAPPAGAERPLSD